MSKPNVTHVQRTVYGRLDIDVSNTDQEASQWLFEHGWLQEPERCESCQKCAFSDLLWSESRCPHWRCLACGGKVHLLQSSIFRGLRCGAIGLMRLLLCYAGLDANKVPRCTDVVQMSGFGRTTCEHFLATMRRIESDAGKSLCSRARLHGNIEVDATFLTSFHVSEKNIHYYDQILALQQLATKRSQAKPRKSLVPLDLTNFSMF